MSLGAFELTSRQQRKVLESQEPGRGLKAKMGKDTTYTIRFQSLPNSV